MHVIKISCMKPKLRKTSGLEHMITLGPQGSIKSPTLSNQSTQTHINMKKYASKPRSRKVGQKMKSLCIYKGPKYAQEGSE